MENKSGSTEAGAKAQSEADSDFLSRLTEEMWKELAGRWVPLGYVALSLPRRHRRAISEHDPSLCPEMGQEKPSQNPVGREAGPGEHPFPPHLCRAPELLVELCVCGQRKQSWPRVVCGASSEVTEAEASAKRDIL